MWHASLGQPNVLCKLKNVDNDHGIHVICVTKTVIKCQWCWKIQRGDQCEKLLSDEMAVNENQLTRRKSPIMIISIFHALSHHPCQALGVLWLLFFFLILVLSSSPVFLTAARIFCGKNGSLLFFRVIFWITACASNLLRRTRFLSIFPYGGRPSESMDSPNPRNGSHGATTLVPKWDHIVTKPSQRRNRDG